MSNEARCMRCGRAATHKITKMVKNKPFDLFLCDEHAQVVSQYLEIPKAVESAKLVDLLQQVLKHQEQILGQVDKSTRGRRCDECGLSYGAYRKTLLLGCDACYVSFEDLLVKDLRKMHGAVSQDPDYVSHEDAAAPLPAASPVPPDEQAAALPDEERAAPFEPDVEDIEVMSLPSLKKLMREAIEHEDFERAVTLRDAIRELEEPLAEDDGAELE